MNFPKDMWALKNGSVPGRCRLCEDRGTLVWYVAKIGPVCDGCARILLAAELEKIKASRKLGKA